MRIDFTLDPALFPFESRFFDSSVGRVHYIDEGSGPTIVMFHGNPTWSFLYRKIVARLKGEFRCIAMDYPGFGLSDRPDGYGYTAAEHATVIGELIDDLKLDGFIIFGQDWGGPIGTAIGAERADRVSGVILGNTWFWPLDRAQMKMFSKMMSSGFMQKQISGKNFFVERVIPFATDAKLSEAEMDHYRGVQPTPESRAGVAEFPRQLVAATPLLSELARKVPDTLGSKKTLFVWGMRDMAFKPKAHLPKLKSIFKDHRLVELPRAKHYIQEDAPDAIAAAIRERFGS